MNAIPYSRQEIGDDDVAAVAEAVRSDYLTTGPRIPEFEKLFARAVGAPEAVAVANGTAALHLAAMALGVKPGQKVITTPITFAASANCIRYCGGDVELVDIDPETLCLDPAKLEQKLEASPRGTYSGVVAVDFGGHPAGWPRLREIADRQGLWLLEDACHALGARYRDGSGEWLSCGDVHHADLSVFSFHPVKHITTAEGGMITARTAAMADRLRRIRSHGMDRSVGRADSNRMGPWAMDQVELGFNYRIPDLLAALGVSQLRKLPGFLDERRRLARRYDEAFAGSPVRRHLPAAGVDHAYHLYVIECVDRLGLYQYLRERGVLAQVHYVPIHYHRYYRELYGDRWKLPVAEAYYDGALSLPLYPGLSDAEQDRVIQGVLDYV